MRRCGPCWKKRRARSSPPRSKVKLRSEQRRERWTPLKVVFATRRSRKLARREKARRTHRHFLRCPAHVISRNQRRIERHLPVALATADCSLRARARHFHAAQRLPFLLPPGRIREVQAGRRWHAQLQFSSPAAHAECRDPAEEARWQRAGRQKAGAVAAGRGRRASGVGVVCRAHRGRAGRRGIHARRPGRRVRCGARDAAAPAAF